MVMDRKAVAGSAILGLVFLAIGVMRFLQGEGWVVWILLGVVLGGVGAARQLLKGKAD
jgi:hypothetical protein